MLFGFWNILGLLQFINADQLRKKAIDFVNNYLNFKFRASNNLRLLYT